MLTFFANYFAKDCTKVTADGVESQISIAYIRGSQVVFIVLPDMLSKAPIFNRIRMWRKFKGHAVFGSGELIGPVRGQSAAIKKNFSDRRLQGDRGSGSSGGGGPPGASGGGRTGGNVYGPGNSGGGSYGSSGGGGSYGSSGGGGSYGSSGGGGRGGGMRY